MASYRFDAQSVRRISDTVLRVERTPINSTVGKGRKPPIPESFWRTFRNDSGEEIPAYGLIAITGIVEDAELRDEGLLIGEKPSEELPNCYYASGPFPVPDGEYAECRVDGNLATLFYDSENAPEVGEFVGPVDGEWFASPLSVRPLALVIGILDEDEHLLLARWIDNATGIGKANETIANRALGDISIWKGEFGDEDDTDRDLEMFNLGPEVEADDWVSWSMINGQLTFVPLCE